MYVTLLSAGEDGRGEAALSRPNPSLEDVEEAVRALDGVARTMVVLGTDGPGHMAIGGGGGRYIVYVTGDNQVFSVPIDPLAPAGDIRMVAGGEEGEFPARQTVDRETAVRAAREYALSGSMEPTLTWEEL